MYVCVCGVLGYLVYDRIRRKSQYVPPGSIKPIALPGELLSQSMSLVSGSNIEVYTTRQYG